MVAHRLFRCNRIVRANGIENGAMLAMDARMMTRRIQRQYPEPKRSVVQPAEDVSQHGVTGRLCNRTVELAIEPHQPLSIAAREFLLRTRKDFVQDADILLAGTLGSEPRAASLVKQPHLDGL